MRLFGSGAAIGAPALVGGAFVGGQTVYPERGQPVVEKWSQTPAAAPVAPPAAPAAPATEEDEAPAEEAAKEAPVEAKEPLADWTVASGGRLGFTARWKGEADNGSLVRWRAAIRFDSGALTHTQTRRAQYRVLVYTTIESSVVPY